MQSQQFAAANLNYSPHATRILHWALAALLAAVLVNCGGGEVKSAEDTSAGLPRSKTLYIAGFQWGDPNTFNPLSDWPSFPVGGNFNLMYEPLLAYNSVTGEMEPLLASGYEKSTDVISVTMDPRARWSDGRPVTASDVTFTYGIGKRFKNAPTTFVWDYIDSITVDTSTVNSSSVERVRFFVGKQRKNPLVISDFLCSVRIVPQHYLDSIIGSVNNDFSAFQKLKIDQSPVVSGPYTLMNYSGEKIVLKRRDDYWGNGALRGNREPRPEYIVHPIYKSNDHFSIALQQGNLDVSATFIPRIWLKAKDGVHTWHAKEPYFIPAAIPMFMVNATHYPLSDVKFRRALAAAINFRDIRELAVSGYSPPVQSGLILPFGNEEKYFSSDDAKKFGISFDTTLSRKLLKEAGYTSVYDKNGSLVHMTDASGKVVPTIYIKSPAGWSDWESIVNIAVKGVRAVGIDAREAFVDAGLYWQSLPTGNFDMLMHKPAPSATPSQPWSRFESVLSSRNWKSEGEKMNENQGRFNNPSSKGYLPAIDSLLRIIPSLSDETSRTTAYRALNAIVMREVPVIPLAYLPEQFYEFSTKHWKNFPTDQNAYAPPQCLCFGAGVKALWEIQPTTEK